MKRSFTASIAVSMVLCAIITIPALAQLGDRSGGRGGASTATAPTQTKELQTAMTPKKALEMLQEGNKRFLAGTMLQRNLKKQVEETSKGQFPFATIVSCIDSRSSSELIFDQGLGDIFNARVAGNIVNEDILGSLEFASKLAGSKLIVVVGHTNCGAIKGACDDAKLDNLTTLLAKIKPAVAAVPGMEPRTSKNHAFVDKVGEMNVRLTMKQIREKSPTLKAMIDKGEIGLAGAMYDLETGKVTFYAD